MTTQNKQQYRIRNWHDYNKALVSRGSLTLWIDTHSTDTWLNVDRPARRGRSRTYTDVAILCSLMLREVYHLPLRATEGLVSSLLSLLKVDLPAPNYSTLSRRARHLQLTLSPQSKQQIKHLVIDSTGLKLYGEGEWRVRQHGWAKHRTWRKLHLCIDADSHQVAAALITNKDVVDPRGLPKLLKQVETPVERVYADGAYDSRECYQALSQRGARAIIPPRKGSVVWADEYLRDRNSNLQQVERLGAKGWKRKVKYHRRSLVECAIFRLKTLFYGSLASQSS
ncbi:MAG TPA: IS5 family transposase [Pyrinomonadaceae bacterium]|nr:IS5 family transposase [Pyrinomonadaceae bacterium]